MPDTEWTSEKIAELRRVAQLRNAAAGVATAEARALASRGGWSAPLDDALSALDKANAMLVSCLGVGALLSLLDELERVREERDAEVSRLMDGCAAMQEHTYWLERYIRDPHGSVRCEDRAVFDPPCGGCEGCLTAQVIYGVTGKAVVS